MPPINFFFDIQENYEKVFDGSRGRRLDKCVPSQKTMTVIVELVVLSLMGMGCTFVVLSTICAWCGCWLARVRDSGL